MYNPNSFAIHLPIHIAKDNKTVRLNPLLDTGATHCFISPTVIRQNRWQTFKLKTPIKVFNTDATLSGSQEVQRFVPLHFNIKGVPTAIDFLVTNTGREDAILGMTWMKAYDAQINCSTGEVNASRPDRPEQTSIPVTPNWVMEQDIEQWTRQLYLDDKVTNLSSALADGDDLVWVRAKFTPAQKAAEQQIQDKPVKTLEEMVPADLMGFRFVFEKEASERLPDRKP